jgi:mycoredoxin
LLLKKLFRKATRVDPTDNPAPKDRITVYGVNWCPDCRRSRAVFEEERVPFVWIDIDENKLGEKFVLATNRGNRSVPTIIFPDGSLLVEPDSGRLRRTLEAYKTQNPA